MKERVLKLCRRLDKFTLDEISTIAEDIDESVLELLLLTLVQEGKLTFRNGLYFYNKQSFNKKYSILSYYPAKILDIVIRCFCLSIPAYKAKDIIAITESSTMQLYYIFRQLIYERQTKKLNFLYGKSPQQCRNRMFFDTEFHFYIYNNQVFVSEKLFQSREEKIFTKPEIQEFKKVYSYLTRFTSHNSNKVDLPQKLAEGIWRRNKEFKELYADLKVNLLSL
ncbi:hypothetical protein [uncultured Eubacterium sp.]|uniref:hypothetical protein n=1 Tax=uncultured Eubacterium sp. TaxID=165185 RepID=UPI003264D119